MAEVAPGVVQQVVAVVSGGLGLGVLLAAFGVFKSVGRVFGRRSDELRRSGVYRWSGNPQLVGYGMFLLAFAVLWPQWQVAVAMLVYAAIAYRMVRVEEEHLLRHYAREYAEYCERTPRWVHFPRVRQDR